VAIYVVSDLHGADDALVKAVPEGTILLLLGDLINFIDYTSMSGILTEVFSVETVSEVVRLRTAGDVLEARRVMDARSEGREHEVRAEIGSLVRTEYDRVFGGLPEPTYLIVGNVDNPKTAHSLCDATTAVTWADGRVFELEGERFGFVGAAFLLSLYALLIWRALRTMTLSKNLYGSMIAGGIAAMLIFHVFINVGMTLGIAPITGIPLPLMSAGGSSVIVTFIALGLLQSIYVQSQLASRQGSIPVLR